MLKLLPEHINAFRYCEKRLKINGLIKLSQLSRVKDSLLSDVGEVSVNLTFGIDEQHTKYMRGQLNTTVLLQCQRCMQPFSCEIMSDFALGLVNTFDEANILDKQYEPVLLKEGELVLIEAIEDEIILNLPIIPKHKPQECKTSLPLLDLEGEQKKVNNPFLVLELLKRNKEGGE
jgi:uncharacterized protein